MKKYILFFCLVIAVVITFSLLLIPRNSVLGLMYKKGRQYDLAKYEFEKHFSKGDLSISVTIPLMELYLHFGEIHKAVNLIERFVENNPKDIPAREMLGNLYRDALMPQKYLLNLENTALLEPTEIRLRELIHLHLTQGDPGKVLIYLKTVVQRFSAKPKDYFDLAFLQAKNGDISDAVVTLEMLEDVHPQAVSIDTKELHIHLLLDLSQFKKGHEVAFRWLEHNFSYSSLTRLVQLFRSKGHNSSALQLLKTFDFLVKDTPQYLQTSTDTQLEMLQYRQLPTDRKSDSPKVPLVESLRDEYIDLQFQNLTKAEALGKMAEFSRLKQLPDSLVEEFIELAFELKEYPLLFGIALDTAPENIHKELLLNLTEITLKTEYANSMKKVVNKFGDDFFSDQPLLGAKLMHHFGDKGSTLRWLEEFETQPDLSLEQQLDLIHFYNKLGTPERATTKLDKIRLQNLITQKLSDPEILLQQKKDFVHILIDFSAFQAALPHLKTLAESEGGDWSFYYEKALNHLNLTGPLVIFWKEQFAGNRLSMDEKKNIVFQLLQKNLKSDAEMLLKSLAAKASPESPEVLQLLFLWGPSVKPEDLNWLIANAQASRGIDRAGWIKHLIQVGASRVAVSVAKTMDFSNEAVFESYLQALRAVNDKPFVIKEIEEKLSTEVITHNLFLYGGLAEDLELHDTARIAFQKVLEVNPSDQNATRKLGFVYHNQKNWKKAEIYLGEYLDRHSDDWKANFYYAEALFFQRYTSKAKQYYLHTLKNIPISSKTPLHMQQARATCLHRLGRKKEALQAYEYLLNNDPNNKALRANLIAALLDWREFDRARALLESQ